MVIALLIEDDSSVRGMIRRAVEPDICTVIEAPDGEAGLKILERGFPPVDLVLVDLMLPGLNGLEVIDAVSRSHPHLPMLCMTGFGATATDLLESTLQDYRVPVLVKPFRPTELAEAVRTLLERANRRSRQLTG